MLSEPRLPSGLVRARRTAATARAAMGVAGLLLALLWPPAHTSPVLAGLGFAIILATSGVQWLAPRAEWLVLEESLSSISGVLIIGLGPALVTPFSLLWLTAVASGVLARGGRVHWIGRTLVLGSLALPIARYQTLTPRYACLCLAAVALLLTCGRVTQELRAMLDRARYDADHDGLTGAISRTSFRERLDRIAAHASDDGPAALLLVDLDNFGHVNKTAGHANGDALLCSLVERMQAALPDSIVGRLGGDEFAAIIRSDAPEEVAQELLDTLNRPESADGPSPLHASIGMALTPRDGEDADGLLRAVDVALRVAKRSGRHQLSVYAGESFSDDGPRGARETLERLISGEDLAIAVQPIVSVSTGVAHAFEALARFQTRGNSSPLHWFALADEFGVRDRLELACFEAALGHLHDRPAGAALSVNLSGPLLLDARTAELLDAAGDLTGLILELTENSLLDDSPGLRAEISRLLALGVRFAVDDMGAGYSGLRQITTLRPSYLKLDRSLITGIDADPARAALVTALLGYARQTNSHVVAEGVETNAEFETLEALGVELVQGFYLARPGWPWPEIRPREVQSGAGGDVPEWADPLERTRLAGMPDDRRAPVRG
jgi:diguanylate cyclase (GGDEF)-like protein